MADTNRTPEEEAAWGPRLSDREIVNTKNGTSYGPETPLVHGVTTADRIAADMATGGTWLFLDTHITTGRIVLTAMKHTIAWLEAQESVKL